MGLCYEEPMAQGKADVTRKHVTFATATISYLEDIVETGTHGSDVTAVIRSLVEQGVRRAIREGLIGRRITSGGAARSREAAEEERSRQASLPARGSGS